jgi:hypothetical protein
MILAHRDYGVAIDSSKLLMVTIGEGGFSLEAGSILLLDRWANHRSTSPSRDHAMQLQLRDIREYDC